MDSNPPISYRGVQHHTKESSMGLQSFDKLLVCSEWYRVVSLSDETLLTIYLYRDRPYAYHGWRMSLIAGVPLAPPHFWLQRCMGYMEDVLLLQSSMGLLTSYGFEDVEGLIVFVNPIGIDYAGRCGTPI